MYACFPQEISCDKAFNFLYFDYLVTIGAYDICSENQTNTNYAQCDDVSCFLLKRQDLIEYEIGDISHENSDTEETFRQ